MSNFVSLEDAAKKLGKSADELVEMRSRGEIFGYRDGGSWKFKQEEIERVAAELMGDALDEDPAGSSILMSDSDLSLGSTESSDIASGDLSGALSDVSLVADPGSGSDVRLVASSDEDSSNVPDAPGLAADDDLVLADSDDDDDELVLAADDDDLELAPSSDSSDVSASSSVNLDSDSNLLKGDSDHAIDSGSLDLAGSDLELTDDGDLVLGGGSDLALGSDSGINLMSPADSGISLEDEPLDLAASGISGLDLAAEGSDIESPSASGSGIDFQQDEEFQLSPSGEFDEDDDSGSQVIELEDSSEFGDEAVALPAEDGFDAFADVDNGGGFEADDAFSEGAPAGAAVMTGAPEVPYSLIQVLCLLGILLIMCLSGILITDVVRNMWAWSGSENTLTSGFTEMVLSAFGQKN